MLKYCFKVFDKVDSRLITQLVVPVSDMWPVLENLQDLGVVKAFVIDSEEEVDNV